MSPAPRKRAKRGESTAAPTEYVVLERVTAQGEGDKPAWREVDRTWAKGGSERLIIERWAADSTTTGTFKLVPARSWKGGVRLFEQTRMAAESIEGG